jgi:hypothetical protein
MLVPRQDLSIKINQDRLKNYSIYFSLPGNPKPNFLFFVFDPKILFIVVIVVVVIVVVVVVFVVIVVVVVVVVVVFFLLVYFWPVSC